MGHLLLTGATGHLGGYLLRDAMLARRPLAVLVRSKSRESAAERIDALLAYWESKFSRHLPRPVVLEGDVCERDLGLSHADRLWLSEHCDEALHGAASIRFETDAAGNEPRRTNVEGTENLLRLCEAAGIRRFHHVSTAYVCSQLGGVAAEDDLLGQPGRTLNAYEASKVEAELLVRSAAILDSVSILRPSIIVGDSASGFCSAFHTIYTPLRLGYLGLVAQINDGWKFEEALARRIVEREFIDAFGLTGDERKNLVPVDWTSAAIWALVARHSGDLAAYHLTNRDATCVKDVAQTMIEAAFSFIDRHGAPKLNIPAELFDSEGYRAHMEVYAGHLGDDGVFDSRRTEAALPELPCPRLDHAALVRMWNFALESDFSWRPPHVSGKADMFAAALGRLPAHARIEEHMQVETSGPGGGAWLVGFDGGRPASAERGVHEPARQLLYANSLALGEIATGQTSVSQAISAGKMGIVGDDPQRIAAVLVPALADWLLSTGAASSKQPLPGAPLPL